MLTDKTVQMIINALRPINVEHNKEMIDKLTSKHEDYLKLINRDHTYDVCRSND